MNPPVIVETGPDFLGRITLNRPEKMNTFSDDLAEMLDQALWDLDEDNRVRVIIVRGAGRNFSAGADVRDFSEGTAEEFRDWGERMQKCMETMMTIGTPVITQVQGVAAGNGAGLVAASDLTVAAEDARIGYTAINIGLFCLGQAVPLSRALGHKQALELLMFGDLISAHRALQMGLVNKVVPPEDLAEETTRYALKLTRKSPLSLQIGKRAFHEMTDLPLPEAFNYMNDTLARLCTSEDAKEGVCAFLEKRKPEWKGK